MTNEAKYLCLTLDTPIRRNKHVNLAMVNATKALMVCNRLAGKSCKSRIIRIESIADFGRIATNETAKTCWCLRIRCNAYVLNDSTRSHTGTHTRRNGVTTC